MQLKQRGAQRRQIAEIVVALRGAGYKSLDQQARALGVKRSTAWAILQAKQKSSGLSAHVLRDILKSDYLPPSVEEVLKKYIRAKAAGEYGHSPKNAAKFKTQMNGKML